ncbi:MAG: leucyl/phenylalanyl-tRNA--protein transferase [Paracoccaceae bacterium]|nr:leucyl/phenylalanyl-tRNA--protein transferase [Paracoccaceae bacterium]
MTAPRLTAAMLLRGYASGIFPMAEAREDPEVFWVDPRERGVLPLDGFHISRSLAKRMRSGVFRATADLAFEAVLEGCADRDQTWINPMLHDLYLDLFEMGAGHSVEVWAGEKLVGGVYGIAMGGVFFGESMFSRQTDASKAALAWLVDRLRTGGFALFDVQFLTEHLASLGAVEIPRAAYRERLAEALSETGSFGGPGDLPPAQAVVQRITQTS